MKIIDVRTKEEFDLEHIKDAINFDVSDIASGKFPDMQKDTPILVYCTSGARSSFAKQALEIAGFSDVTNGGSLNRLKAQEFRT